MDSVIPVLLSDEEKEEVLRRSEVHLQTNGLLVSTSNGGLELDGQSHYDGWCSVCIVGWVVVQFKQSFGVS